MFPMIPMRIRCASTLTSLRACRARSSFLVLPRRFELQLTLSCCAADGVSQYHYQITVTGSPDNTSRLICPDHAELDELIWCFVQMRSDNSPVFARRQTMGATLESGSSTGYLGLSLLSSNLLRNCLFRSSWPNL